MKCHTNDNSTSSTQLPHKFSYIVAILGHNHFESPNNLFQNQKSANTVFYIENTTDNVANFCF
jgi:spore cortex formation protein SpoVR/YcgB (stage V sporulation)